MKRWWRRRGRRLDDANCAFQRAATMIPLYNCISHMLHNPRDLTTLTLLSTPPNTLLKPETNPHYFPHVTKTTKALTHRKQ